MYSDNNGNVYPSNSDMRLDDGAPAENATAVDSTILLSEDHHRDFAMLTSHIFSENKQLPVTRHKLPEPDERLQDTAQLAYCLFLLKVWSSSPNNIQEPAARDWLRSIGKDEDESGRIKTLAMGVIKAFTRTELNDANAVAE
ncbi:hypothetical protein BGZ65_000811, partial [Modicella reniformis]